MAVKVHGVNRRSWRHHLKNVEMYLKAYNESRHLLAAAIYQQSMAANAMTSSALNDWLLG
jgi:hypothetical protein